MHANVNRSWILICAIAVMATAATSSRADNLPVQAGYDLLQTDGPFVSPELGNIPMVGLPITQFNFGDGKGPVPVGNTDTIVMRQATADLSSGSDTIPIELVALSLVNTAGNLFVHLDPSQASTGELVINADGTMETRNYNVHWVAETYQIGSPNDPGQVVQTGTVNLDGTGRWEREGGSYSFLIDGINTRLNGSDTTNDFHPGGMHDGPHPTRTDFPEPATAALFGIGGLLMMRRSTRQA